MPASKELQDVWNNPEKYKYAPVPGDPSLFRNIQCEEYKDGKMVRRADGSPCYYYPISSLSYNYPGSPFYYSSRDMVYPTSGFLFTNGICRKGICMTGPIYYDCFDNPGYCISQTEDKYYFRGIPEHKFIEGIKEGINENVCTAISYRMANTGRAEPSYVEVGECICLNGISNGNECSCREGTKPYKKLVSLTTPNMYTYGCCRGEIRKEFYEVKYDCDWFGNCKTKKYEYETCLPEPEVAWKTPEKTGKVFEARCPDQITCLENRGFFCNAQTGKCEPSKCDFNKCEAFSPTPSCVFKENSDGKYELSQEESSCKTFCKEGESCIDGRCYNISCKTHEDCKDNELCINNQCIGELCLSNLNCGKGKVCSYQQSIYGIFNLRSPNEIFGKCIGATCNYDSDCGEGDVCLGWFSQGKRCQPNSCIVGVSDCAGNKQCQNGKWVLRACGESATCPTNSWFGFSSPPCGSKELCSNGACVECLGDNNCGKDYSCVDGKCIKEEGCPFACEIENCYEPDFNGECRYICEDKEKCVKGIEGGKGFCVPKINENCEQWNKIKEKWVYICKSEEKCINSRCVNKCNNCQRAVLNPDTNEVSCVNNCLDGKVCIRGFAQYFPEHKTSYKLLSDIGIYGSDYLASEKFSVYQEYCGYENKNMLEEYKAEPMRGSYGNGIPFSNLNEGITFTRLGCKSSCEGKPVCANDGCGMPCQPEGCMDESSCNGDRIMVSIGSCENFQCVHSEPEFFKDCLKTGMYGTCSMCKETPEHTKEAPDCPIWDFYKMCGKTKTITVPKTAECVAKEQGSEPAKVSVSEKDQVYPMEMPDSYSEFCQIDGTGKGSCAGGACPYGQNSMSGYSILESNKNEKNNSGFFERFSILDSILNKPKLSGNVVLTGEAGGCTGGSCPNPQIGGGCKCGQKCEECLNVPLCSSDEEEESCPIDNNRYIINLYSLDPMVDVPFLNEFLNEVL